MATQIAQHPPSFPGMNHAHPGPHPPRYSSLAGALSPEAASVLQSLCAEAVHTLSNADNTGRSGDRAREVYPPRYSGVFQRSTSNARYHQRHRRPGANNYSVDSQLVAGSHPFEYHIRTGHGSKANRDQPWATLKVFSRSSSTSAPSSTTMGPRKMPKFTSKDLVQGCLELNLDVPQNINSILLSVRCSPALAIDDFYDFLVDRKDRYGLLRRRKLYLPQPAHYRLDTRTWRSTHRHLEPPKFRISVLEEIRWKTLWAIYLALLVSFPFGDYPPGRRRPKIPRSANFPRKRRENNGSV